MLNVLSPTCEDRGLICAFGEDLGAWRIFTVECGDIFTVLSPNFYYNIHDLQKKIVVKNFYRDLLLQNLKYSHMKAEIFKNSPF